MSQERRSNVHRFIYLYAIKSVFYIKVAHGNMNVQCTLEDNYNEIMYCIEKLCQFLIAECLLLSGHDLNICAKMKDRNHVKNYYYYYCFYVCQS